ncbi:MAG: hypothetical protein WAW85_09725 [Gordonia sp. (in: high G+C Gram-positive bacteria)]|uniref:hypothetical protein n=1 Tax=Gordonia sp. (in: high G+C Gram-positive bacteria) TaxID=84139 RepID=UPI003BB5D818
MQHGSRREFDVAEWDHVDWNIGYQESVTRVVHRAAEMGERGANGKECRPVAGGDGNICVVCLAEGRVVSVCGVKEISATCSNQHEVFGVDDAV